MRLVTAAPVREVLTCKEARCYATVYSYLTSDSAQAGRDNLRDLARNVHKVDWD